ncbi:MAG: CoA-transferase, partial [Pseudooceanicola atlanticus]
TTTAVSATAVASSSFTAAAVAAASVAAATVAASALATASVASTAHTHTENGVLNFGPAPAEGEEDWDLINAGKKAITLKPGAAFFHHADSFAMVRGGHLDVAILGAFQIAQNGDLANWSTGKGGIPAVGGAMDLVQSAKRVAVLTDHVTKHGDPKLVERCTMPLTGVGSVTRIYSSLAVVDIADGHFWLREKVPGISFDDLQAVTGAALKTEGDVLDLIVSGEGAPV